ncbi:hypothetical protein [Bartonella sp. HY038]|uniref:hypothetical protein n=1 Tax=Bartonella sp. HY038 TaxID=2759660 RepID=UPI00352EE560
MGEYHLELYENEKGIKHRIVCNYIAGITDYYASKKYQRLFMPDIGSIYDQ